MRSRLLASITDTYACRRCRNLMIRQMAGVGGAGAKTTFWAEGRKHT